MGASLELYELECPTVVAYGLSSHVDPKTGDYVVTPAWDNPHELIRKASEECAVILAGDRAAFRDELRLHRVMR